ncbi:MAG: long-chain fatty acid--CoA ligase [Ilumatobacteraceae bacterium]
MDQGIGSWVTVRAELQPGRTALVAGERELTYADLEARTNQVARALLTLGVRRGDRVGMLMLNSVEFMELVFATAKLGAIAVPINFRLGGAEVGYILDDAGCDVLAYHRALAPLARAGLDASSRVRVRLLIDTPAGWPGDAGPETAPGELDYAEVTAAASSDAVAMTVDPRDVHGIMYTSGTTGRPKGAMLTHGNAIANARHAMLAPRAPRPDDVTITAAPMFHIGGLGVHSLPFVYVGAKNVIVPAFDPAGFTQLMAQHRATVQFLVPAMWAAITRLPDFDGYDLSALELCLSGGAPTPLPVIEFFNDRGVMFQEGFGMTETAPSVSILDPDHIRTKLGSIGQPIPGVRCRFVDEEDHEVPVGEVGELVMQGDNIIPGYWMLPEASAEAWRGDWFHSGDLGRVDDEGYMTLVDRKKDMVITGGENVYPVEVEQVIVRHPAVREVAIFGVPDARWGETVVAAVALDDQLAPADLIAWTRERLAHFKCPTRVEVVDELPRNATGKVLKTELRAKFGGSASAVSR